MGTPLGEAERRLGSLDTLLLHLRSGRLPSCAAAFYGPHGRSRGGKISASEWVRIRDIDPTLGWARFAREYLDEDITYTGELEAVGIEVNTVVLEELETSMPTTRRRAGAKEREEWVPIVAHLNSLYRDGKIFDLNSAFHAVNDWLTAKKLTMADSTIRGGIKRHWSEITIDR